MAKKSAIERNLKRIKLGQKFAIKREKFKAIAADEAASLEDRYKARLSLSQLPRNSSPVRQQLRCELTGRPRGNYRKFKLSRIALRQLASAGQIPGMVKSSW